MTLRSLRIALPLLCTLPLLWTACGGSDEKEAPKPRPASGTPAAKAPAPAPAAAAPAASAEAPSGPGLADIDWKLVKIEPQHGDAITPDSAATPTIRFNAKPGPDGVMRLAGFSGCNSFMGEYSTDGSGSLSMPAPIAMTKMACEAPIQTVENQLMMSLGAATGFSLGDGELSIQGDNGTLLFAGG